MKNYEQVIKKIKETSIKIARREVSKAYVDYYTCWEKEEIARFVREEDMIIIDKYFVDYGTGDFIETLITHECCHLLVGGHNKEFQNLFTTVKKNCHWDASMHPDFLVIKDKLIANKILDEEGNWKKQIPPENKEVKKYVLSQMAEQDKHLLDS